MCGRKQDCPSGRKQDCPPFDAILPPGGEDNEYPIIQIGDLVEVIEDPIYRRVHPTQNRNIQVGDKLIVKDAWVEYDGIRYVSFWEGLKDRTFQRVDMRVVKRVIISLPKELYNCHCGLLLTDGHFEGCPNKK